MRFVPRNKLSKKARRALDATRRRTWGGLAPVTRRVPDKTAYSRKKTRQPEDDGAGFFA